MSKFKIEFSLKQHTPLIHFQSEQSGATLRATELKPKFDRFLIKNIFGDEFEKYKSFLIGYKEPQKTTDKIMTKKDFKGKMAFDYKVKIIKKKVSDDKTDLNGLPDDRLFMGNMGGGTTEQMYHRNSESTVSIIAFDEKLRKEIKDNFSSFMMQTNFGGGSSKGFGSFTDKKNKVINYPNNCYSFKVGSDKLEEVYERISYFYKMLKSGINEKDKDKNTVFYGKSFLWLYVNKTQENAIWEKKKIKESFFNLDIESSNKEPFLYRDLLGLSLESDWMSYSKTITKKSTGIARFPSPITFKPILEEDGYHVYFWGVEVSKDILDKKFTISDGSSNFEISTPKNFNINEYLEFVSKQSLATHIDRTFQGDNKIFKTLNTVFNSILKVEQNSKGIA